MPVLVKSIQNDRNALKFIEYHFRKNFPDRWATPAGHLLLLNLKLVNFNEFRMTTGIVLFVSTIFGKYEV